MRKVQATVVQGRVQRVQGRVDPPLREGRDRERERHREAHVAHVEDGGMDDEADVLEKGVEVPPDERGGEEAGERVRGEEHEAQEPHRDEAEDAEDPRRDFRRKAPASCRDGQGPAAQDERPEEEGAFVGAPDGRDSIVNGQERVRVRGDVEHREVVRRERPREAREGEEVEHEEPRRRARSDRHPARVAPHRARERRHREDESGEEREDEREVAELGDHCRSPVPASRSAAFASPIDSARAGGM